VKKVLALAVCFLPSLFVVAQSKEERREARKEKINSLIRQEEEGVLIYHKHTIFGLAARTTGYGAFLELGRMKDRNVTTIYQMEFSEIKDPKERKDQVFQDVGFFTVANTPFIYGKQNFFYSMKFGYGQLRRLGDKGNKNGVSVQANYLGGISVGIERPYYIRVITTQGQEPEYIKYQEGVNDGDFLGQSIFSGPGLFKGWGESKINPGLYGKGGLRFDYGRFNEVVSAIEVGLTAEVFAREVPIMVNDFNQRFFFSAYISILFGKRK
jgi:hypothetical protein